jgi:hypothetical protein
VAGYVPQDRAGEADFRGRRIAGIVDAGPGTRLPATPAQHINPAVTLCCDFAWPTFDRLS